MSVEERRQVRRAVRRRALAHGPLRTDSCLSVRSFLQAVKAGARRPPQSHAAFMRDDVDVLFASVAYGMGINKPGIRRCFHWGHPASLESYYQQVSGCGVWYVWYVWVCGAWRGVGRNLR
jgi:hypothetical protein